MYLHPDTSHHNTGHPDFRVHRQLIDDRQEALRRAARDTRLLRRARRDRRLRHRVGPAR